MPSGSTLLIRDPNRHKTAVRPWDVLQHWRKYRNEKNLPDPEHSWNSRASFSNITPAMVKAYIESHLRPVNARG